jgi:hypothetical protein
MNPWLFLLAAGPPHICEECSGLMLCGLGVERHWTPTVKITDLRQTKALTAAVTASTDSEGDIKRAF